MKNQQTIQAPLGSQWKWSIDLETYDRRSELDAAERAGLELWMSSCPKRYGTLLPQTVHALQRLLRPLDDVFELMDINPKERLRLRRITSHVILQEVACRQTTFWAWTVADWIEIIGQSGHEYRQRYQLTHCRQDLLAIAYVLCRFMDFWSLRFEKYTFATRVFGQDTVDTAVQLVLKTLGQLGYGSDYDSFKYHATVCTALLANRSPHLEDLTEEVLVVIRQQVINKKHLHSFAALSTALQRLGILNQSFECLNPQESNLGVNGALEGVPAEWADWCQRWFNTSTLTLATRKSHFYRLLVAGRWLAQHHPDVTHPAQWTRQIAANYVAAVNRMLVGEFSEPSNSKQYGKPLSPKTKHHRLMCLRRFFQDCQEWEWIPENLNPQTTLLTPRSILALIGPRSQQIADEVWAKLICAGLKLTKADLDSFSAAEHDHWYPIEMVRAVALVWLFCGLRQDDIRRLRVGCIRWLRTDSLAPSLDETNETAPEDDVCQLDVPPGKNGEAFTKPVDSVVGKAINAWEQVQPEQPLMLDLRTSELVHYLFAYRGQQIGTTYLNKALIPLLCYKAGVPEEDVRGKITSHRARHTILTQLSESMTLPELQSWSGHKQINSLSHYLKLSPTKQAQAYQKTEYFKKNLRTFEVLIDTEAITSGAAAVGEPWKYHDLGEGYCTYDFYEQCPHRMACTKCSFYKPKNLVDVKLLESKTNLQRMLQEISLTEEERLAIEDGIEAFEQLCERLADVPTPAGLTPRQISSTSSEDIA